MTRNQRRMAKQQMQDASGEKVAFLHSIKLKIALMLFFSVALAVTVVLLIVVPSASSMIREQAKNYLLDVTTGNGASR